MLLVSDGSCCGIVVNGAQVRKRLSRTRIRDLKLLHKYQFVWVRTFITRQTTPQSATEKLESIRKIRRQLSYVRDRADLVVAIVESGTAEHIDDLGMQKRRREFSRKIAEFMYGIRITPHFPTGTFITRVMTYASRCKADFIPHHIYDYSFLNREKKTWVADEVLPKCCKLKLVGVADTIYHLELFILNTLGYLEDKLKAVCCA